MAKLKNPKISKEQATAQLFTDFMNRDILQNAIKNGADLNAKSITGKTVLMNLIEHFNTSSALLVLKGNVNPNLPDAFGLTALSYALIRDNKQIVSALIKKGSDVNVRSENFKTPLMIAASDLSATVSTIKLLLDAGANLDLKDKWGKTALIYAIENENEALVELLLTRGADVGLKDQNGHNARSYAANTLFSHEPSILSIVEKYEKQARARRKQESAQKKALLRKDVVTEIISGLEKDLGE